jgi:hypothetical protein
MSGSQARGAQAMFEGEPYIIRFVYRKPGTQQGQCVAPATRFCAWTAGCAPFFLWPAGTADKRRKQLFGGGWRVG